MYVDGRLGPPFYHSFIHSFQVLPLFSQSRLERLWQQRGSVYHCGNTKNNQLTPPSDQDLGFQYENSGSCLPQEVRTSVGSLCAL